MSKKSFMEKYLAVVLVGSVVFSMGNPVSWAGPNVNRVGSVDYTVANQENADLAFNAALAGDWQAAIDATKQSSPVSRDVQQTLSQPQGLVIPSASMGGASTSDHQTGVGNTTRASPSALSRTASGAPLDSNGIVEPGNAAMDVQSETSAIPAPATTVKGSSSNKGTNILLGIVAVAGGIWGVSRLFAKGKKNASASSAAQSFTYKRGSMQIKVTNTNPNFPMTKAMTASLTGILDHVPSNHLEGISQLSWSTGASLNPNDPTVKANLVELQAGSMLQAIGSHVYQTQLTTAEKADWAQKFSSSPEGFFSEAYAGWVMGSGDPLASPFQATQKYNYVQRPFQMALSMVPFFRSAPEGTTYFRWDHASQTLQSYIASDLFDQNHQWTGLRTDGGNYLFNLQNNSIVSVTNNTPAGYVLTATPSAPIPLTLLSLNRPPLKTP